MTKKPQLTFLYGIAAALIGVGIILYGWAWLGVRQGSLDPMTVETARLFHMPVGKVNGNTLAYADYADDIRALNSFYEKDTSGLFGTAGAEEISGQVVSRLIANTLIEGVAKEYNVTITPDELKKIQDELIQQFGDEETARQEIAFRYGFTLEQFMERVVKPAEREQKLMTAFAEKNASTTQSLVFQTYMDERLKQADIKLFSNIKNPLRD